MQISVHTKRKRRRLTLVKKNSGLKTLTRSIARGDKCSIARQVAKDPQLKQLVIESLAKHVHREMQAACSSKNGSILRSNELINRFKWCDVLSDVQKHAPTLVQVLKCISEVKRYVRSSDVSLARKRKTHDSTVGLCLSILLRHRSMHMNLVQKTISLIFNAVHASEQVIFNKCTSNTMR